MPGVRLSEHFGLVIRKEALQRCGVDRHQLLVLMEADAPLDEDDALVSFGPHFGGEATQTLLQRLEAVGIQYGNDVIDIADTLPDWLQLHAHCTAFGQSNAPTVTPSSDLAHTEYLLDIWRVLEALTVSLDRIGMYEAFHGTEAGQRALHAYLKPPLFDRIAQARDKIVEILVSQDPGWKVELEYQSQDANTIGYWQGERNESAG
jgi:hypothetical protein